MLNPVWYYKPTGQWKDEIEKFQGICLYRSLGVLKSVTTRTMQRDAEILPVSIRREKKTCDRFAIRAIRDGSPRNPVWNLANRSKTAECDIERLFLRVKQMNGVEDDKYWVKCSSWKQLKCGYDKKSHKALQKLKATLHVASWGECQLDYKTSGEHHQCYTTTERERYGRNYLNPLGSFMGTVPCHSFSNMFQPCRGNGVLEKYFQMRFISERNHHCECGQLEITEHLTKDFPRAAC